MKVAAVTFPRTSILEALCRGDLAGNCPSEVSINSEPCKILEAWRLGKKTKSFSTIPRPENCLLI